MQKNKLKNMHITSVDFVKRGANQAADICLYKSADGEPQPEVSALKKAYNYLRQVFGGDEILEPEQVPVQETPEKITKSDVKTEYSGYICLLNKSFDLIIDGEGSKAEKAELLEKSLTEFFDFMKPAVKKWTDFETAVEKKEEEVTENKPTEEKDGANMNMNNLTPQEQETLKNLPEFVTKALERSEAFIQQMELKEMEKLAKKYEVLGEKPEELAKSLYELKGQNEAMYNTTVAMLDKQVDMIEKSGLFTEIGKSGGASAGVATDTVGKVESFAKSIMEKNPEMSYQMAMAKAWEDHPELVAEYENERR